MSQSTMSFSNPKPRCILAGEVMTELSQASNDHFRQGVAGDVYNTAVYLKRCLPEGEVSLLTALGGDTLSLHMKSVIQSEGIDTSMVLSHPDKQPGLYAIHTDEHGERSFQYWRSDSAARLWVNLWLTSHSTLPAVDLIYLSGITLAVLDNSQREQLLHMLCEAREAGSRVAFDPNYRPALWQSADEAALWTERAYQLTDIAFPGIEEHKLLFGHQDGFDAMDALADMGVSEIVCKNGTDHIQILHNDTMVSVEVTPVDKVIDTTSAGDGFTGGYLAARLQGKSVRAAAEQAARVAGIVIQHPGAIVQSELFQQAFCQRLSTCD